MDFIIDGADLLSASLLHCEKEASAASSLSAYRVNSSSSSPTSVFAERSNALVCRRRAESENIFLAHNTACNNKVYFSCFQAIA